MEEVMSPVLYALVLWILASVPLALFFGAVCRLNQRPLDADAARIALVEPHDCRQGDAHRSAALGAAQPMRP
jgi:hypothetical protein